MVSSTVLLAEESLSFSSRYPRAENDICGNSRGNTRTGRTRGDGNPNNETSNTHGNENGIGTGDHCINYSMRYRWMYGCARKFGHTSVPCNYLVDGHNLAVTLQTNVVLLLIGGVTVDKLFISNKYYDY